MFEIVQEAHCNSCGNRHICARFPVKIWGPPKPVEAKFDICGRCLLDALRQVFLLVEK